MTYGEALRAIGTRLALCHEPIFWVTTPSYTTMSEPYPFYPVVVVTLHSPTTPCVPPDPPSPPPLDNGGAAQ
jgi:hypothetical protein